MSDKDPIPQNPSSTPVPPKPADVRTPLGRRTGGQRPTPAVVPPQQAPQAIGPQVASFTSKAGGIIRIHASGDLSFDNMEPVTDPKALDILKTYLPRIVPLVKLHGAVHAGLQFDLLGKIRLVTASDANALNEAGQVRQAIVENATDYVAIVNAQEQPKG